MTISYHHEFTLCIVDFIADSTGSFDTNGTFFPLHGFRLCSGTGLVFCSEVRVVPHVSEHTTVAWIQASYRCPAHIAGLMPFKGGWSLANALINEEEVICLLGIFRHFCLAFVDICLTYRDSRWCIDTVVETIIIFEGEIFSGLFEEAVEGEEFCQIFLRYFTAEASKTEIVRLGISAINGGFTEFLKEFVEEGGLFTKFYIVEPQLPIHA